MSEWLTHLKQFYKDKKKTSKDYSYKQAMVDAAKTYRSAKHTTKRITRRKNASKKQSIRRSAR